MGLSTITDILSAAGVSLERAKSVQVILTQFTALSPEEKKGSISETVRKVFPLVFGDSAAVQPSAHYEALRTSVWSTNCYLSPATIVTPSSAHEISIILALVRFLGATFSIKGGGHLQNPGFQSNNGGVVINLHKLNQTTLSEDKKTASIGMGAKWMDVYDALGSEGLAVSGARVPTVGVAGYILGGGLSFQHSGKGLACMNVVDYEVVLADSSIVHANSKDHADLFWALKGGCSNFGVVTKVKMTTVSNRLWAAGCLYSPDKNEEILDAISLYQDASEKDSHSSILQLASSEGTVLFMFYAEPVEKPDVFKSFYDIPIMMDIIPGGLMTVSEVMVGVRKLLSQTPLAHELRVMATKPDPQLYRTLEQVRVEIIEDLKDIENHGFTTIIQTITSGAVKISAENRSPMGHTPVPQTWYAMMAEWPDPSHEDRIRAAAKKLIDTAEKISKEHGTYLPYRYANYSSRDQDPIASYGKENVEKLREIAKKYDSEEVFQKLQNGGWLLSKVGI